MKQMRSIGLAVLVTLMLLSMPGKAGHAKETPSPEWVTALPAAAKTEQLIVVGGVGKTTAWISMHEKEKDGRWHQIMTTPGFIGREGLGKEKEGDWKSPAGTFRFNKAFGIARDPGCAIPYTQVDKNRLIKIPIGQAISGLAWSMTAWWTSGNIPLWTKKTANILLITKSIISTA